MSREAGQAPQAPVVSGSQVLSAGFASAGAAIITSKFGVAGTLLGAALTTMIITGGAAILKAYLESMGGTMLNVPQKIRERRERRKAERYERASTLPGRPDLRNNFAGRMRAALGWFSHLPPFARRPIIVKALLAALIAFVIGMSSIYAFEKVINNNLSCGIWANCAEGRSPGIHLRGGDGTGGAPTISLKRGQDTNDRSGGILERRNSLQQGPGRQDSGYQPPARQRNPSGVAPANPGVRPVEPRDPAVPPGEEAPTPGQQLPEQPPADGAVPDDGVAPSRVPHTPAE